MCVSDRERERGSERESTHKLYYIHHMRSAYFPINRTLHREEREREQERERQKERERDRKRKRCEMVKTQKQYYHLNMRSAYFSINRR